MEPKAKRASLMIWIPEEMRHKIKEKALSERKTVKWVVTDLLVKWLKEKEK